MITVVVLGVAVLLSLIQPIDAACWERSDGLRMCDGQVDSWLAVWWFWFALILFLCSCTSGGYFYHQRYEGIVEPIYTDIYSCIFTYDCRRVLVPIVTTYSTTEPLLASEKSIPVMIHIEQYPGGKDPERRPGRHPVTVVNQETAATSDEDWRKCAMGTSY